MLVLALARAQFQVDCSAVLYLCEGLVDVCQMFVDLNFLILSLHIFHTFFLKTSLTASKYLSVFRGTHKYLCVGSLDWRRRTS